MCFIVKYALCVHLIYSDIIQRSREELKAIRETNPGLKPTLAIIQVCLCVQIKSWRALVFICCYLNESQTLKAGLLLLMIGW